MNSWEEMKAMIRTACHVDNEMVSIMVYRLKWSSGTEKILKVPLPHPEIGMMVRVEVSIMIGEFIQMVISAVDEGEPDDVQMSLEQVHIDHVSAMQIGGWEPEGGMQA